jgi:vacuolar-type H+-ATPase subunit H
MDTLVGKGAGIEEPEEDALREVLGIERQAQGILQDAEAEAQRIVASAEQRAEEIRRAAEREVAEQEPLALEQAYAQIEQEAHAIELAAEKDARQWAAVARACLDAAVSYVLDIVTLGELTVKDRVDVDTMRQP